MRTNAHIGPFGLKLSVIPNGGWRFPIPAEHAERLGDKFFRGYSYWTIVNQVRIFRIQLGLKVGAVEWEVAEYTKGVSPDNALHKGRVYPMPEEGEETYRPPIVRVTEWLVIQGMKRGGPKLVIKPDADERAAICEKCSHNIQWQTPCKPCVEEVDFRMKNLRQRPVYENDAKLGACRKHWILIGAGIFLDADDLPGKAADSPSECWLPEKP